jgi:hypothetical protein
MTKATLLALASLVIVAGPVFADGARGSHGHGGPRLRTSLPTRVFPHHRSFGRAPVIGYGIAYGVPAYVPSPPGYYPWPSSPSVSDAPRPVPTVVEYPNGRYVLHGDGISAAYRWVWVPNPPSREPPAPPPPPAAPATHEPAPIPIPPLEYYRWTDADGVTHLTDSIDRVPEHLRAKARSRT